VDFFCTPPTCADCRTLTYAQARRRRHAPTPACAWRGVGCSCPSYVSSSPGRAGGGGACGRQSCAVRRVHTTYSVVVQHMHARAPTGCVHLLRCCARVTGDVRYGCRECGPRLRWRRVCFLRFCSQSLKAGVSYISAQLLLHASIDSWLDSQVCARSRAEPQPVTHSAGREQRRWRAPLQFAETDSILFLQKPKRRWADAAGSCLQQMGAESGQDVATTDTSFLCVPRNIYLCTACTRPQPLTLTGHAGAPHRQEQTCCRAGRRFTIQVDLCARTS